jgi:two-component system response regulator RegX3
MDRTDQNMRIVIVKQNVMSGKLARFVLTEAGYDVILIGNAAEAFISVIGQETAAVLLDTELPGMNGYDLCKELRARHYNGPVMFVTPRKEMEDKLIAFDVGADDYVVEPFDPRELAARVHSIVRRWKQADYQALGTILKVEDTELHISESMFFIEGRSRVQLTPTEMRVLECLMRNSGITISRDTLIERIWGYDALENKSEVDVYIRRLRKKIEQDAARPEYIHTVRGFGYVFRPSVRSGLVAPALTHEQSFRHSHKLLAGEIKAVLDVLEPTMRPPDRSLVPEDSNVQYHEVTGALDPKGRPT